MPYIYKITNDINDKIYIGKTTQTIQERFRTHIKDSKRGYKNRPLYNAINKYGIEHFSIEEIEECPEDILNDREKYWIEYYGSYKYGYNGTLGGDGRTYLDYELVYKLWKENNSIQEIHNILGYDKGSISKILSIYNISSEDKFWRGKENQMVSVAMVDKDTNKIIKVFSSIADAYNELGKQHSGHITSVCKGQRKTAYGYKWKYI